MYMCCLLMYHTTRQSKPNTLFPISIRSAWFENKPIKLGFFSICIASERAVSHATIEWPAFRSRVKLKDGNTDLWFSQRKYKEYFTRLEAMQGAEMAQLGMNMNHSDMAMGGMQVGWEIQPRRVVVYFRLGNLLSPYHVCIIAYGGSHIGPPRALPSSCTVQEPVFFVQTNAITS